jgi:acetyltransferase-like isoleucine patch superfamily enzyme
MSFKKALRAVVRVATTNARLAGGKLLHGSRIKFHPATCLAFTDVVELSRKGTLDFGKGLRTRGHCVFNVQEEGVLSFGEGVFLNTGCQFNCRMGITVGDGSEFGPNVFVYDHDHDYRAAGGIKDGDFIYNEVSIGKNCWIGANVILLRGTALGDGCVVGAGSVLKGSFPSHALIYQPRSEMIKGFCSSEGDVS